MQDKQRLDRTHQVGPLRLIDWFEAKIDLQLRLRRSRIQRRVKVLQSCFDDEEQGLGAILGHTVEVIPALFRGCEPNLERPTEIQRERLLRPSSYHSQQGENGSTKYRLRQ